MSPPQHVPPGGLPNAAAAGLLEEFPTCLRECGEAEDLDQVHAAIHHFSQALGFSHFLLMHLFSPQRIYSETLLIPNHPKSWFQRYHTENYYREDPVLEHCQSRTVPLLWQDITLRPGHRDFVNVARAHGLEYGVTFPIHAAGEWGFLSFNWQDRHDPRGPTVNQFLLCGQLFAAHVQDTVRKIQARRRAPQGRHALTQREKQCLLWSAEGKTAWETARILSISERTVVFHLNNAAGKLDASNRTHAAIKALPHLCFDIDALQRCAYSDTACVTVVTTEDSA